MTQQNQTTSATRNALCGALFTISAGLLMTQAQASPTQTAAQAPVPAVLHIAPDAVTGRTLSRSAERRMIQRSIVRIARANGVVPVELALAVARVESNFHARAESPVGARGVMQIMPRTAMGEFDVEANDLWDAELNITLGIRFLEQLYRQYGRRWDAALSHYNGGTLKGDPRNASPHGYTAGYVAKVLAFRDRYVNEQRVAALAVHGRRSETADSATDSETADSATDSVTQTRVAMMIQAPELSTVPIPGPQKEAPRATAPTSATPDVPISFESEPQDDLASVPVTTVRGKGRGYEIVRSSEDLGRRFRARLGMRTHLAGSDSNSQTFRNYGYRRSNQ